MHTAIRNASIEMILVDTYALAKKMMIPPESILIYLRYENEVKRSFIESLDTNELS